MSGPLNLNVDTSATKTAVPKFIEQTYIRFRLAKLQQDHVEGKGDVIKFEWALIDPVTDADGQPVKPGDFGATVFDSVQLYDKNTKPGDSTPAWALKKIAQRQDALLGTGDPGNTKGKPARPSLSPELVTTMIGQVALLKFKNKTGDFDGQDISALAFPGDVVGAQ